MKKSQLQKPAQPIVTFLEITLLSERLLDKAKTRISDQFKSLKFENQELDSGKAIFKILYPEQEGAEIERQAVQSGCGNIEKQNRSVWCN